ncbi:hypothetical protein [Sphingomonas crusticola]|uniref:hypothetical protein n=1 Tax=Sphingomonas crusticola TaxID=1697973 RepID=UPI000E278E08|nr:hypothetical protein [Sphingomonas crusticola]
MKRVLILLPLLALAGCMATPEQRVKAALVNAGVAPRVAGCMAERMADRLSIEQLKELKALTNGRKPGEKLSAKHILKRVASIGDPEVVSVTTKAAIGCTIAG